MHLSFSLASSPRAALLLSTFALALAPIQCLEIQRHIYNSNNIVYVDLSIWLALVALAKVNSSCALVGGHWSRHFPCLRNHWLAVDLHEH